MKWPDHEEGDPRIEELIKLIQSLKYGWHHRGKALYEDLIERGYTEIEIRNAEAAADILEKHRKLEEEK